MTSDEIEKAAKATADYLYTIKGDCSPELAQAIGNLRQLINEEFVPKDKSVSSQLIFNIISPAIHNKGDSNERQ